MMRFLILGVFALSSSLFAADVTGKWTGSYDVVISDGQVMKGKVTVDLAQEGGDVTGTLGSDEGQMKVVNGKVDGDRVTFDVKTEGGLFRFDLKLEDAHMRGTGKGDAQGSTINVKLDLARA